jgi:hypothetical protein
LSGEIELFDDQVWVVDAMIDTVYHGDYSYKVDDVPDFPLMFHAKVSEADTCWWLDLFEKVTDSIIRSTHSPTSTILKY